MAQLNFAKDVQGFNTFASPISDNKYSATIAAAGNATITLPASSPRWIVSFSYQPGSNIWVAFNGSAAVPAGATFASTGSELLPGSRVLNSVQLNGSATTINFINNGSVNADIGVVLYASA